MYGQGGRLESYSKEPTPNWNKRIFRPPASDIFYFLFSHKKNHSPFGGMSEDNNNNKRCSEKNWQTKAKQKQKQKERPFFLSNKRAEENQNQPRET